MSDKALRLSLSTILGAGIILCLVVGGLSFLRFNRADDHTTSTLTQKANALFTAIEAGARSGRKNAPPPTSTHMSRMFASEATRFEEGLKRILEELGDQPDIRFVAVTDPEGRILAYSDPRYVGSALFSPIDMEELDPSQTAQWRMIDFLTGQAFLVYREFTPLREPMPPLPAQPMMRRGMMRMPPQPDQAEYTGQPEQSEQGEFQGNTGQDTLETPEASAERKDRRFHHGAGGIGLAPVIFVAYDPAPYIKAQTDREHQSLLETAVSTLLGLVALVLLFWRENLNQTRRLLGDTRAFANEVVGSFPDGLVILDTDGKPIYVNSTARRFLGIPDKSARKKTKGTRPGTSHTSTDNADVSDTGEPLAPSTELIGEEGFLSPSGYPALPPVLIDAMKRLERNNFSGSQELPCLDNLLTPIQETEGSQPDAAMASGAPDPAGELSSALENATASESPNAILAEKHANIAGTHMGDPKEVQQRDGRDAVCWFELRGARVNSVQDANLLHNGEKEHLADLLIIRDLTELKNLQHNLRQSEKLAAVGSLAAGVAHEIRNPLSSIKGYASIFARMFSANSPEQEAALAMVREAERLNRAVSDLLSISSSSNLRLVSTNFTELLEHSVLLVNADARKQGVNLDLHLAELPPFALDPDRISQAVLNLLLNALEAMPDGGTLKISLVSRAGDRTGSPQSPSQPQTLQGAEQWAVLSIADSGKGISPADLPQVFDAYFTTKAGGTGLGLATTQKIIQAHSGRIEVQSGPGGTTFVIHLPINRPNEHSN